MVKCNRLLISEAFKIINIMQKKKFFLFKNKNSTNNRRIKTLEKNRTYYKDKNEIKKTKKY
jgi:hypothetical protein